MGSDPAGETAQQWKPHPSCLGSLIDMLSLTLHHAQQFFLGSERSFSDVLTFLARSYMSRLHMNLIIIFWVFSIAIQFVLL
ncbi:hypothetical protein MKX03_028512, partial [Papaver bracteatum]